MEKWKSAAWLDVEVSTRGRVRCLCCKRILRPEPNAGGYMRVRVNTLTGRRWCKVHLLVLETFIGPRPSPRYHGAHAPSNNKRNNRLENLRWATPEENEADKKIHGTHRRRVKSHRLTPNQWLKIHEALKLGMSISKLAKIWGVHRKTIARFASKYDIKPAKRGMVV